MNVSKRRNFYLLLLVRTFILVGAAILIISFARYDESDLLRNASPMGSAILSAYETLCWMMAGFSILHTVAIPVRFFFQPLNKVAVASCSFIDSYYVLCAVTIVVVFMGYPTVVMPSILVFLVPFFIRDIAFSFVTNGYSPFEERLNRKWRETRD